MKGRHKQNGTKNEIALILNAYDNTKAAFASAQTGMKGLQAQATGVITAFRASSPPPLSPRSSAW
jgi:hypothetical protein